MGCHYPHLSLGGLDWVHRVCSGRVQTRTMFTEQKQYLFKFAERCLFLAEEWYLSVNANIH